LDLLNKYYEIFIYDWESRDVVWGFGDVWDVVQKITSV